MFINKSLPGVIGSYCFLMSIFIRFSLFRLFDVVWSLLFILACDLRFYCHYGPEFLWSYFLSSQELPFFEVSQRALVNGCISIYVGKSGEKSHPVNSILWKMSRGHGHMQLYIDMKLDIYCHCLSIVCIWCRLLGTSHNFWCRCHMWWSYTNRFFSLNGIPQLRLFSYMGLTFMVQYVF